MFQSSIAPKSDRNVALLAVFVALIVPILDRPEERPQSRLGVLCDSRGVVPILDRPEERPQLDAHIVDTAVLIVPILDRPEERPQSRNRVIYDRAADSSNPRSPRRATAICA